MSNKQSPTMNSRVANGTFGNLNKEHGLCVFQADTANTVYDVLQLEGGTKMTGFAAFTEALGAGTSLKLGYRYLDGDDGAANDVAFGTLASANAGELVKSIKPMVFENKVVLTVTLVGGSGTGQVDIIPEYINLGTK